MTDDRSFAVQPLKPGDPPMVGKVVIRGRLTASDSGIVYAGRLVDQPVTVVILTAGAEADSFGRARFESAVDDLREAAPTVVLASDTDREVAPWVAITADTWATGVQSAAALLAPVTLADRPPSGEVSGPGFRPHWARRTGVGRWRLWPLPWPSQLRSAAAWTMIAALALVLAIATIALWIAVRIFDNQPVPQPPPGQRTNPFTQPVPPPISTSPTTPPNSGGPSTPSSPSGQPTAPGSGGQPTSVPPIV